MVNHPARVRPAMAAGQLLRAKCMRQSKEQQLCIPCSVRQRLMLAGSLVVFVLFALCTAAFRFGWGTIQPGKAVGPGAARCGSACRYRAHQEDLRRYSQRKISRA